MALKKTLIIAAIIVALVAIILGLTIDSSSVSTPSQASVTGNAITTSEGTGNVGVSVLPAEVEDRTNTNPTQ